MVNVVHDCQLLLPNILIGDIHVASPKGFYEGDNHVGVLPLICIVFNTVLPSYPIGHVYLTISGNKTKLLQRKFSINMVSDIGYL